MADEEIHARYSSDTLVMPFIFVRHGEPEPTEWLERHSDPIRIPAIFVPHSSSDDSEPGIQDAAAAIGSDFGPAAVYDDIYTHLRRENVTNTDFGYHLYQTGAISP